MINTELLVSWGHAPQHLPKITGGRSGSRETGAKEGTAQPGSLRKMLKPTKVGLFSWAEKATSHKGRARRQEGKLGVWTQAWLSRHPTCHAKNQAARSIIIIEEKRGDNR